MEFDKDKSFGYPVLRPLFGNETSDQLDYLRSTFELLLTPELNVKKPDILTLNYTLDFSVPEFSKYIEAGKLGLYLDIRCKKTYHSEKYKVDQSGMLEIGLNKLRDIVSVCPFILAETNFKLKCNRIHPDFGYTEFHATENSVIAWCPPTTFSVEKELFRSVRSIIDYQPTDIDFGEYIVDADNDYVVIYASTQFIEKCKSAERVKASQMPLIGCFFTMVISELIFLMADQTDEFSEKRWFQVLEAKCGELSLDWENKAKIFSNAQSLLKSPLTTIAHGGFLFND